MGGAISHLIPCLNPDNTHALHSRSHKTHAPSQNEQHDVVFSTDQPLDETLGHSFCYVPSSGRFLSPTNSDRFIPSSNSQSLRFDEPETRTGASQPVFRAISGASVSANTATPRTFLDDDVAYSASVVVNGFDCTSSFSALPLMPAPRGDREIKPAYFLSGPIERGAMSGPLDSHVSASDNGLVPYSAPLSFGGGLGVGGGRKKRRKRSFAGIKNSLHRSFSEKKRPWVVLVGRKEGGDGGDKETVRKEESESNVQWALGKAGEDRVHVVVSEEHEWLFVGIYDGFNGPDGPEFLMSHLYRGLFSELKGLFWDNVDDADAHNGNAGGSEDAGGSDCRNCDVVVKDGVSEIEEEGNGGVGGRKRVTFVNEEGEEKEKKESRRKLWEFLAEDEVEDGLDLSGSERFAFSVDDAVHLNNVGSRVSRSSLLSKLKQGWSSRGKDGGNSSKGGLFHWRFRGVEDKGKVDVENRIENEEEGDEGRGCRNGGRRRRTGSVDHGLVLRALERALEKTENAYLDLTHRVIDRYPELALMGSCVLVVLMRDEDVYVMNLGDSRAIVAQFQPEESCSNVGSKEKNASGSSTIGIIEECTPSGEKESSPSEAMKLTALQLSTDHSTSIEEEVERIKREHLDDNHCIVNDRVKGRLTVTRAFGAGFLKEAKFNESLLEMFRNEFIGDAPYVSCIPSLRHHQLGPRDQFLVLSSDGLYQYLSNQEVVSFVDNFLEKYPDGDPAQHLIEELLNRAAKKAGMNFHDLLDIPQGDRRKYHDDVTVMVISLEGRIWKSSGKYP